MSVAESYQLSDISFQENDIAVVTKGYKELKVWQRAKKLVIEIYKITGLFPKEEIYGLTNQMRRCAVSIPSNIAEEHARSHKEFIRFLDIAYGSLNELETQLEIACDLEFLGTVHMGFLFQEIKEIGMMLNGLRRSLADGART